MTLVYHAPYIYWMWISLNNSIHIIGAGNPFYGDDGVAQSVIQCMKLDPQFDGVIFHDIMSDPFALLDKFNPSGLNIIVDAARMGLPPGTIRLFSPDDVSLPSNWTHFSLHGISLPEIFALAKQLDIYPAHLVLVGIEPKQMGINQSLSKTVELSIPDIIKKIKQEIQSYERKTNHTHHR